MCGFRAAKAPGLQSAACRTPAPITPPPRTRRPCTRRSHGRRAATCACRRRPRRMRGGARAGRTRLPRHRARGRAGRLGRVGSQRRPGDRRLRHEPGRPRGAGRSRDRAAHVGCFRRSPRLGSRPGGAPRDRLRPALGPPARGHPNAPARRTTGPAAGTGGRVRVSLAAVHGTQRRRGAARDDALLRCLVRSEERPPAPAQLHAGTGAGRGRSGSGLPRGIAGHAHRAGRSAASSRPAAPSPQVTGC